MAQTGFTPISLYYSSTATNVPTNTNLAAGELAINTADGKLFYKDSSGVVQVLATKGGVGSSTTTQVLYNSSGSLAGSANMTFDGTKLTVGGLKNSALTSGRVTYATTNGELTDNAGLTFNGTNLTLGTSNGGIIFNNSSALTNSTLNDYEVGTWTPNQGGGLVVVGTFSSTGSYTKIGRMVTVSIAYYGSTSVGTTGGGQGSSNFPFTTYAGKLYTAVVCNNAGNFGGMEITGTSSYFQTAIPAQPQMFMSFTYECNF